MTLDDTSAAFRYTSETSWSFLDDEGRVTSLSDTDRTAGQDQGSDAGHGTGSGTSGKHSVAVSSGSDSKVDLAFKGDYTSFLTPPAVAVEMLTICVGSAVYVYGQTGPDCGQAKVMLDDKVVAYLNMTVSGHSIRHLGDRVGS